MTSPQDMATFESRLATFETTHATTKKRASNAKGTKGVKWPHATPSPSQLAQAGFYFTPTSDSADNVTCFTCRKIVDGWDPEDNPIKEHLALSPSCGWALQLGVEQSLETGNEEDGSPTSERMMQARKDTFADLWPHEKKRGWTCKTQKMAEAGWYYCPTMDSDDFVKCAYCSLSLDGWEPKDKPYDEHFRRSPDCAFFTLPQQPRLKAGRSKKGRASKASRMSVQSTTTMTMEDHPILNSRLDDGESIMTTTTENLATKPKKAGRPKKGQAKAKAIKAQLEEQPPSSFIEPEDDTFEVKAPKAPATKNTRGKKRPSDSMEVDNRLDDDMAPPPPKRRGGTRSSTIKPNPEISQLEITNADVHMADGEDMPQPIVPKKGAKRGGKRSSSIARKASTASKATLKAAIAADDEIDAALEADLNRPMSDNEDIEMMDAGTPAPKRGVRTAAGTKKGKVPAAPLEGAREASALAQSEIVIGATGTQEPESMIVEDVPPINNPRGRPKKGKAAAKSTQADVEIEQTTLVADTQDIEPARNPDEEALSTSPPPKAKSRTKGRQTSRKQPAGATKKPTSIIEQAAERQIDNSMLSTATAETNVSDATVLQSSKKASAATKKGKKSHQPLSKDVEAVKTMSDPEVAIVPAHDDIDEKATIQDENVEEIDRKEKIKPKVTKGRPKTKRASTSSKKEPEVVECLIINEEQVLSAPVEAAAEPTPEPEAAPTFIPPTPQHQIPSPTPSPQSSDAENHPPSSRPSQTRPPLLQLSPTQARTVRIPLATTPKTSPSKRNALKLNTTFPWSAVDLDYMFMGTPKSGKENMTLNDLKNVLTSTEKKMTVEEWISYNAKVGEENLRNECEEMVGKFESEGVRALKALEGIVCQD